MASAKKQLFLDGVDYDDVIAAGGEILYQRRGYERTPRRAWLISLHLLGGWEI